MWKFLFPHPQLGNHLLKIRREIDRNCLMRKLSPNFTGDSIGRCHLLGAISAERLATIRPTFGTLSSILHQTVALKIFSHLIFSAFKKLMILWDE